MAKRIDMHNDKEYGLPGIFTEPKYRWFRTFNDRQIIDEYYISGKIESPINYVDMVHGIRSMAEGDQAHIYLNTPGGDISTAVQLLSAIKSTQGTVITHAEGECMSAGTILFLNGHGMIAHDHTLFMFHDFQTAIIGAGGEMRKELDALTKWVWGIAREAYKYVLSDEEVERISENDQIWLTTEEMIPRLDEMTEMLKLEAQEMMERAQAEEVEDTFGVMFPQDDEIIH